MMVDDIPNASQCSDRASLRHNETVTNIASRRREENVLASITLVFDGVHYGTIPVGARYAPDKPVVLYLVPARGAVSCADGALRGPLDCLITDDVHLALDEAR
jgi:hypothetical protein